MLIAYLEVLVWKESFSVEMRRWELLAEGLSIFISQRRVFLSGGGKTSRFVKMKAQASLIEAKHSALEKSDKPRSPKTEIYGEVEL